MTAEITTLPAPEQAEETVRAVEGEVIEPMDLLRKNEANIRKNFVKFEKIQESVARSLNIIYHNGLWKLHKTADGKKRYTNFNDYLTVEFGWDKTAARARQIMKADQDAAIEAGDVPPEVGDKRRERTAPEVTAQKAARVTVKQITNVVEAFMTRLTTVETGEGYRRLEAILVEAEGTFNAVIDALDEMVADLDAESEEAETETDSAEDDAAADEAGE